MRIILIILLTVIYPAINAQAQVTPGIGIIKPSAVTSVSKYITEKNWNELFPNRHLPDPSQKPGAHNDFYSYKAFLAAASYFPSFLSDSNEEVNRRELCAFLANMAYETGGGWKDAPGGYYKWGLYFTEERNCDKGCPQYSDPSKPAYVPVAGQSYHGRGGLQLSWNYNYGQFSETLFGTKDKLLQEPDLVAKDPVLAFASALWFWTTPQYPKPSCHDIVNNTWHPNAQDTLGHRFPGFGAVVNVINGGLECGKEPAETTAYRYGYYRFFCQYFKVSPGENPVCTEQRPFGVKL